MKRSGQVGLVLMGAAAFAATFAGGMAYFGWQKQSHAAQPQSAASQTCTPRADGTQNCQAQRRGFAFYLYPTWGSSSSAATTPASRPQAQTAALSNNSRAYAPSSPAAGSNTTRGGFGSTASNGSYRTSSAGG